MNEVHLTKKDFRVDWFSGRGSGGQYRNKHQNCCRITHLETGLMTTGQSNRERPANQKEAFTKLARLLIARHSDAPEGRRSGSERVRTYHAVRNQVLDHASGRVFDYRRVMSSGQDVDTMIAARRTAQKAGV